MKLKRILWRGGEDNRFGICEYAGLTSGNLFKSLWFERFYLTIYFFGGWRIRLSRERPAGV